MFWGKIKMFEEKEMKNLKEETVRECLVRKFKIGEADDMDWYIRNVVNSLKLFIEDDVLAKMLISDFYLLFMKLEREKEKAEIEKAEIEKAEKADDNILNDINNLLDSTIANLDAIIATLE